MMRKFEVGQLFEEGKTQYLEGVKFDFQQSGAILFLFFGNPTLQEIEDVKTGKFEFGFYAKDEVIFLLSQFSGMQWMDAPYSAHLSKPFEFIELEEGQGYGLNIFFVDASTGILKVIRYVGLSTDFSKKFRSAVEKQKAMPFDSSLYQRRINGIYGNYSTEDLVKRADSICRIK